MSEKNTIVIVGAGPAGLVCAAELVEQQPDAAVTVIEKDPLFVGGIARTMEYKGFRFDIGPHRFFSKNEEIAEWWVHRLGKDFISIHRLTRILYRGVFFEYPLKAMNALLGLGIFTSILCVLSYLKNKVFPVRPENSFQDWVSNRFGGKLFSIFFKTYTEKVWGTPCSQISADWAAQRIKGLSLLSAVWLALFPKKPKTRGQVVKTLIDRFHYPRHGSGQMWEKTRDDILKQGGKVWMGQEVVRLTRKGCRIVSVTTRNPQGQEQVHLGDEFIVTMPLRETMLHIEPPLGETVLNAARNLTYRDIITVPLMVRKTGLFEDNWIYVHDPSVRLGRLQNFNNWSPDLIPMEGVTCLGLEYFCFQGDDLWNMSDADLVALGKKEVAQLGLAKVEDIFDGTVFRIPKAYPVYAPNYQDDVEVIRRQIREFENLQVVGRNGMHKYNNMDHSMLSALLAARRLSGGKFDPWNVNSDAEYHEEASVL